MKSIKKFIRIQFRDCDFSLLIDHYNNLNQKINNCKGTIKCLLKQEKESKELSLEEIIKIDQMLKQQFSGNLMKYGMYNDKLKYTFGIFKKYEAEKNELYCLTEAKRLLVEDILFETEDDYPFCNQHQFIFVDDDLTCIHCGKSTKDYQATKEEKEVLSLIASDKNMLIREVKKEDLPFLMVLQKELENQKKEREEYYKNYGTDIEPEERFLEEEEGYCAIPINIRWAHLLDAGKLTDGVTRVCDPKYFNLEESQKLQDELSKKVEMIEKSNLENKQESLKECAITKYEILILSGYKISDLLSSAKSDLDIENLTRAYYNLTNSNFRKKSLYFKSETDAELYYVKTANEIINNKILELKLIDKI